MLTAPVHPSGLMAFDDGGEWHLPVQIITWLHQHGGCLWSLFNSHHQVRVNSCSSIGQRNAYKPAFVYFCCSRFPGGLAFMRPDVIAIWGSTLLAVLDVSAPYLSSSSIHQCLQCFYHGKAVLRRPRRALAWADSKYLSVRAAFPYSNQIIELERLNTKKWKWTLELRCQY